ncbi:unnamed protein product (macronuclear) [Paramecium tetraurelia]|uniref:SANT domain-containing protein n=1 Tax=Paramecium tetraurelia TaxID=5888 RepID=A0BFE4_PARTE|nr:uncharacterized protein GSPATT00028296001 [Paramecium tetraurelia]CAK57261.1 unnamed protein product [Paramecium tetraurelia]|eukprot:XP_001424659.1 hypothetical protein (macronuclear) [Paramecium tetraurelia strain d4-2]
MKQINYFQQAFSSSNRQVLDLIISSQQLAMKNQSDEQQENQNNSTQFEDNNGIDLGIRKVIKLGENGDKTSTNLQYKSLRDTEQQKQVIQQIKHLARQGSHMYVTIFLYYFDHCKYSFPYSLYYIIAYLLLFQHRIFRAPHRDALIDEVLLEQVPFHRSPKLYFLIFIIYFFIIFLHSKFLPPNSITPLIFTKKLPQGGQYRQKGTQPLWVNAFESLLSVVVQLYYKSDQKLAEFMKEKVLIDSKKDIKQEKKPGRKKKILDNDSPNQEQIEQQQPNSQNVYSLLQQDVLDILISPLRNDFSFETWTTKEIAIFECGLCRYGKQYEFLSHLRQIKTKNAQDIIQFYYNWKFTSHYKLWKINKAYYHRSNLNNYV